ncbi:hypothetical protein Acy02nite_56910 [Actinoplanes cyaneus]|uniref:Uncharacterized protein n=2 Tax=Actinoplanes cyaneus TaxID=52696 RepID=A0A919ITL2_9ACTN|nr:hypothetical protein Acy02nite_56910 [Actinoplanes cyaneus]
MVAYCHRTGQARPTSTERGYRDAGEMLERQGGLVELEAMYDRLMVLVATRPATKVVRTRAGEIEQAYRDFRDAVA